MLYVDCIAKELTGTGFIQQRTKDDEQENIAGSHVCSLAVDTVTGHDHAGDKAVDRNTIVAENAGNISAEQCVQGENHRQQRHDVTHAAAGGFHDQQQHDDTDDIVRSGRLQVGLGQTVDNGGKIAAGEHTQQCQQIVKIPQGVGFFSKFHGIAQENQCQHKADEDTGLLQSVQQQEAIGPDTPNSENQGDTKNDPCLKRFILRAQ